MSSDSQYLLSMVSKLEPIEISKTISNEALLQTICSLLLTDGCSVIYLTDSEEDAWLYIENNQLIAAKLADLKGDEALHAILKIEFAAINCSRHDKEIDKEFSYGLNEFLTITEPQGLSEEKPSISYDNLRDIPHCKGYVSFKNGIPILQHNLVPDAVPLKYLQSLWDLDKKNNGFICTLNQYKTSELYYCLKYINQFWIFKFRRSVNKDNISTVLLEALEKTHAPI